MVCILKGTGCRLSLSSDIGSLDDGDTKLIGTWISGTGELLYSFYQDETIVRITPSPNSGALLNSGQYCVTNDHSLIITNYPYEKETQQLASESLELKYTYMIENESLTMEDDENQVMPTFNRFQYFRQ